MNAINIKKYHIIQQITMIQDLNLLQKIQDILAKSGSVYNEDLKGLPSLHNHEHHDFNDKEDFTDYIKEWVKNM